MRYHQFIKKQGVAEGSETNKYHVVVVGHKRSYDVWVDAKNEDVAIIRAQQYVTQEHNDTTKRASVVDMKKGVAEDSKFKGPADFPTEDGITWQDIRLLAGEGKLTQRTIKQAIDVIRKQRTEKQGVAEGSDEQVYKVVALDKSNALKKPTKLNVKASSIEDVFSRLAANDWYALSINGVEVVAGKRLKQGVAEAGVKQLPTKDADYSKYDTDHLKMLLRPGILHRNEARFKALIRKELQKREQQGVAEGLDKNKINDVLNNIRSGKTFANLSTEDQTVLMTVIDEAKSKLLNLINSDNQIKTDWPHVKKFIDSNQSLISMMSWDAWFKLGIIKQNPNQNTASISNDEIIVNPNLYNVLQWRFIITWLQNRIQRNKLTKSDIDLIFKLKTLIDNNPGVAEGSVNDYFKRRKDEEDRIAGTKAPAKRTPQQTDYEKKRKDQGVAEGSDDDIWGPQGNFAGDTKVDVGNVSMKKIQVDDIVKYFGQQAKVVEVHPATNYARISTNNKTLNVKLSDLKQLGQGVSEDQLDEKWSEKYKRSIDCGNPKGFSQRAHCAGKKKDESVSETEIVDEVAGAQKCWPGHRKVGTQPGTGKNAGKRVNKCEKIDEQYFEETYHGDEFYEAYGDLWYDEQMLNEAEYQGRKVQLGKPMRGDVKKFKVYVKNPQGNIVKVNFGDPNMRIKKSNPARRKSFRARHNCDNPGPRHKARYWSCRKW